MKNKKPVLISDFDGTITRKDFFHMVSDTLLPVNSLKPWHDYMAGRITHLAALDGIFAQIRITRARMDKFIASIPVDRAFYNTLAVCKRLKIPVYICSAGSDYYINKRIGGYVKKYNIGVLANSGEYSPQTGLHFTAPPKMSPFYNADFGISKEALVNMLSKQGYFTIYAGDGKPDIDAAKRADVVFARDMLAKLCKLGKVPFFKLNTFKDITDYLRGNYGAE